MPKYPGARVQFYPMFAFATIAALLAGGVLATVTPAVSAQAAPLSALAGNGGFTVVTEGNSTLNSQSETEGSWAVGGNLTQQGSKYTLLAGSYQPTASLPVVETRPTRLLVGGSVTLVPGSGQERLNVNPGDGYGNVTIGAASPAYAVNTSGEIRDASGAYIKTGSPAAAENPYPTSSTAFSSVIPASAFADYRSLSTSLLSLAGAATPTITLGPLNGSPLSASDTGVTLVSGKVNVWNPTATEWNKIQNGVIKFYNSGPADASTPLIINVPSSASSLASPEFSGVSADIAKYVLWNVQSTATFTLDGSKLMSGAVLAPNANLVFNKSTPAEGQYVAKTASATGNAEIHHIAFIPELVPPTTPGVADAAIVTKPATCDAPEAIDLPNSTLVNATWTTNPMPTGAGTYTVVATANQGFVFAGGSTTKSIPVTLAAAGTGLNCVQNVAQAAIATTTQSCANPETIDLVNSTLVHATWTTSPLPTGPGTFVVVATADLGYAFADGSPTKSIPVTLAAAGTGLNCVENIAAASIATTPPTCAAPEAIDLVNSTLVHATWTTSPLPAGAGTYTVVATADSAYAFPDGSPTKSIPVTLAAAGTGLNCVIENAAASIATKPATCDAPETIDLVNSSLMNATWTTNPMPTGAGSYSVVATAITGHSFAGGQLTLAIPVTLAAAGTGLDCPKTPPVTPPAPPALASTGSSIGGGLGLAGALLVLAGIGFAIARKRLAA